MPPCRNSAVNAWAPGERSAASVSSATRTSVLPKGGWSTQTEEHHRMATLLRSHGMTSLSYERSRGHAMSYDVVGLGYNYRIDDIRASLGLVQLRKLAEDQRLRADVRRAYLDELHGL